MRTEALAGKGIRPISFEVDKKSLLKRIAGIGTGIGLAGAGAAIAYSIAMSNGAKSGGEFQCVNAYGINGNPKPTAGFVLGSEHPTIFNPKTGWWVSDESRANLSILDSSGHTFQVDERETRSISCNDPSLVSGVRPVTIPAGVRSQGGDIQAYVDRAMGCNAEVVGVSNRRDLEVLFVGCRGL